MSDYYLKLLQDAADTMRGYWGAGAFRQCTSAVVTETAQPGIFALTCEFREFDGETLSGSWELDFQPRKSIENAKEARRAVHECITLIYREADFLRFKRDAVTEADKRMQTAIDSAIATFNATHEHQLHAIKYLHYNREGYYSLIFEYLINGNIEAVTWSLAFHADDNATHTLTQIVERGYENIIERANLLL